LCAEVVWRRHNAGPEMVLPQAIDRDASQEITSTCTGVCDPIRQGAPTPGCPAARRRRLDPMLFTFRGATEHMQEARTHFLTLLPRIAAFEEVRFRIEMGEAAVVRMMRDGFETLAGDHDFLEVWFWLNLKVCLHGVVQLPPIRVERPIPGQECGE